MAKTTSSNSVTRASSASDQDEIRTPVTSKPAAHLVPLPRSVVVGIALDGLEHLLEGLHHDPGMLPVGWRAALEEEAAASHALPSTRVALRQEPSLLLRAGREGITGEGRR